MLVLNLCYYLFRQPPVFNSDIRYNFFNILRPNVHYNGYYSFYCLTVSDFEKLLNNVY